MTPHSSTKDIFCAAAEMEREARAGFLDTACGGDEALRKEVEKLLDALDEESGVLGASTVGEFLTEKAPESWTLAIGHCLDGRFGIVRRIGAGGMGEVYEAEDLQLGVRIAVKTLKAQFLTAPQFTARFRREIKLARIVTHPNVCRVFDIGRVTAGNEEIPYLTMELLHGETLLERIKRGPMAPREALPVIRQIADALRALHRMQVIHRDLKPSNVIIEGEGRRVVITDFGLAHAMIAESDENVTLPGQIMGTPAYAAPEQLTGKKIGPQADVYSLGVVMYEMLSGRRPFEGETSLESAAYKLTKEPPPPSSFRPLDAGWDRLILRCLERKPEDRFQNVAEIVDLLSGFEPENGSVAVMENGAAVMDGQAFADLGSKPGASRERRGRGRRIAVWAAVAVMAVMLLGILRAPVAAPVRRPLCRLWPGSALVCDLPANQDMAILPFRISGSNDADRALAGGIARYIREGFHRLATEPEKRCIHLRTDRASDGVSLVFEGEVAVRDGEVKLRLFLRESKAADGKPLLLRKVEGAWNRASARDLFLRPMEDLARSLQMQYPVREWEAWKAGAPRHPESVLAYLEGLGYLDSGQYEAAAGQFHQVIDPTRSFAFSPAHAGLGDAYRFQFNKTHEESWRTRARGAYERALPLDRDFGFAGAERSLGDLDAAEGDKKAAAIHYASALRLWPFDQALQKRLVYLYESEGRFDEAAGVLRQALRITPKCWLIHTALGGLYSRHGRMREAENSFLEVIRLAPDNGSAYHNLAFDYIKSGRFDDAIEMASKSLLVRAYPLAYSTLGRAFFYRGCQNDAMVNLKKAVEMDPEFHVLRANLADALHSGPFGVKERMEASQRVVDSCRRALQKTPTDEFAQVHLGLNLARLGKKEESLGYTRRGIRGSQGNGGLLLSAAEGMELAGYRGESLELMEKALQGGLFLREAEMNTGLAELRKDGRYGALLRRLGLDPESNPVGLSPPRTAHCPEWGTPGKGWQ